MIEAPPSPTPSARLLPFMPQDDPVFPLPSIEEMELAAREQPAEFLQWMTDREKAIKAREENPFSHGYEPQIWGVVDDLLCRGVKVVLVDPRDGTPKEIMGGSEVLVMGGNRSSKSEYAASRVVRKMVAKAWARAWCFHTTGPSSTAMQQPRVWKYLPPAWKNLKRHRVADIKYSFKNGFAGATPSFVGPNASQCWFKNYAQDISTIEGEELDICWMDELVPMPWIEAVRFRLATRNGVLIITFTAVEGYSATVKGLIGGAKDVLRVEATLLPDKVRPGEFETVPRVRQAAYEDLKVVNFHIFDNPFGNEKEVIKKAEAGGREGILLRVYGEPTKQIGAMFPTFRPAVHVISVEQFQRMCAQGTNKHYVDPCSGRNWAMIWARALPDEQTIVIYREWPSPGQYVQGVGDPGPWAESDGEKPDGRKGSAQKPWGFGLERYAEEILRAEGWTDAEAASAIAAQDVARLPFRAKDRPLPEAILERDMDSRFGAAPTVTRTEAKTLIESMAELGMNFEPAPGEHQREGIDQINDLLYFDSEKPIGPENKPRLIVVECCKNLIWALENWTGLDGQHGACKDFIDLARYMALSPPVYLTEESFQTRGGGSY